MNAWSDQIDDRMFWRESVDGAAPRPSVGFVRGPAELGEDMIRAVQAAQNKLPPDPRRWECNDSGGHVSFRFGPAGLLGCTFDTTWARDRDGAAITEALMAALRDARSKVPPAPPNAVDGLDDLVADALATLRSLASTDYAGGDRR